MRIAATLNWDGDLTDEDAKDFLKAIEYVKLLTSDQMRMNKKTHDVLRALLLTTDTGEIDTASKDGVLNRLNGIKVHIDNRRPDNTVQIY